MRKALLVIALLCYTLTSAFAQKLTLTNNSCGNVFIRLHADDNSGCGPASVDESDAIYLIAGSSMVYNFTGTIGTNSTVGPNFVWISTGTAGTPSATLSGPPSTFNFFKADVWSSCATWPVSASCTSITGSYPGDGVIIDNPNCPGISSNTFATSVACGACAPCGWTCTVLPNITACTFTGSLITATFSTSGSDWSVTIN